MNTPTIDAALVEELITKWTKQMPDWVGELNSKPYAKALLPVDNLGASVQIDQVIDYSKTGNGAKVCAKGHAPAGTGVEATPTPFPMFQLLDGFGIHDRDMTLDKQLQSRNVMACMDNIQILENSLAIAGDTPHGIVGLVQAAQANPNGVIASTEITASWDAASSTIDPYADLVLAISHMGSKYKPRWLVGNTVDLSYLAKKNTYTRTPFYQEIAPLLGKSPMDKPETWQIAVDSDILATGKVYLATLDKRAGKFGVSENPHIMPPVRQRGGVTWFDVAEWSSPEYMDYTGFVEIDIKK